MIEATTATERLRASRLSTCRLEDPMKYGAGNNVVGKVTEIKKGSLMCQVKVSVDGPIDLSSVMTLDTLAELGVKTGDSVRVLVKSVNVVLVRE